MIELPQNLNTITDTSDYTIDDITREIAGKVTEFGYEIVETNDTKPWGAYLALSGDDTEKFLSDFFPNLSAEEARRGNMDAPLKPKFLIVSPGEELSLQTHERRAERWLFLTPGSYYKGMPGGEVQFYEATAGEEVQFDRGDIHRLCNKGTEFVVVAEIWQHSDPDNLSDEDDIERLEDKYTR